MLNSFLVILLLIAVSAFFSISEISLAVSRQVKLKLLADEGDINAERVLKLQETPGLFFTVIQIGLNGVAILGGIVGDSAFSPWFNRLFINFMSPELAKQLSFILSFSLVTAIFILFADLTPKRIALISPESYAVKIINPMRFCLLVFRPLVWIFNGLANVIFRILKLPMVRKEDITSDDIYAVVEAGALAGVLRKQEHALIENVFKLELRTVSSSMISRENIIYFDLHETEESIKEKIAINPHFKFLICDVTIDHIVGYVNSKDLLNRLLNNQNLALSSGVQIYSPLIVPNTLTIFEVLESFKNTGENFAVILNEYALVVGVITLNNVMSTLMGDLVGLRLEEEQIIARDEKSWLIEGRTPIDDVMCFLDIDEFPQSSNYETIGGFMMFMLRKIPKRTDFVKYVGYKFEVVDIDSYKIDQLLVTRVEEKS
ncbi:MAG: hemolysin family protein [Sodalis sp. (in: enterobacteria)]